MLGALFRVREEFAGEAAVLDRAGPALARPRDGVDDDAVAPDGDERFGARTDDAPVAVPEQVHVRRGVHLAQRGVQADGVDLPAEFPGTRDDALIDVAVADVFFRLPDRGLVVLARTGVLAGPLEAAGGGVVRRAELFRDALGLGDDAVVHFAGVVVGRDDGGTDEADGVLAVVERERSSREDELGVRVVRVGALAADLVEPEVVDGLVGEEADQPAGERLAVRLGEVDAREVGERAAQGVEHVAVARADELRGGAAEVGHVDAVGADRHDRFGVVADEREARVGVGRRRGRGERALRVARGDLLGALQEEAVVAAVRERRVRGQRVHGHVEVGHEVGHDRSVRVAGEGDELLAVGVGGRHATTPSWSSTAPRAVFAAATNARTASWSLTPPEASTPLATSTP